MQKIKNYFKTNLEAWIRQRVDGVDIQCPLIEQRESGKLPYWTKEAGRLHKTHFPGCLISESETAEDSREQEEISQADEDRISRIVGKDKIRWMRGKLSPFEAAGPDGIFPVIVQKSLDLIEDAFIYFCALDMFREIGEKSESYLYRNRVGLIWRTRNPGDR